MHQSLSHAQRQSPSRPVSIVVRTVRRGRVALSLAGALSVVAGMALAFAPAASAASSTYAVTEVPFFCCATGVAADPATDTVYVAAPNDEVAVVDGATDAVTAQIGVANFPALVAVDQASDTVYAIVQSIPATPYTPAIPAAAEVINGATDAVTTTISLPSGLLPGAAGVNPVTHMVYVADYANGTVVVIDGNTDTVAATISLADPVLAPDPDPLGLAVDSETNTVYVSDFVDNQIAVIDGEDNTVTGRIAMPSGSEPTGVAVDPAAGLVYVADQATGEVSAIDTATDDVSTLASGLTDPVALALDSGSGTLYASASAGSMNGAGMTYVIGTASGAITAQIPRGGGSIAVPAPGGSVFVGGSSGGTGFLLDQDVTVITPSTANTMSPVIVGTDSLTFDAGQAGQEQLTASATPAAMFSATGLPDWLTLSQSGLLSGTPPASAEGSDFVIAVTAANGIAPPYTADFSVTVDELPAINSADQANFTLGVAGSFTVTATGYPAAAFSESGPLPAGVTFSSTGSLSGTPAAGTAGTYPMTVTASNTAGSATQAVTLTVAQAYEVQASQQSGFCLDNTGGSTSNGNPIQVWSCLGDANQGWTYVPSVNGVAGDYQLQNSNGLCLDDPGDSAVNGTRVQLWTCLGDPSQTWTQVTVGSYVEYVNPNGLCLDNTGNALTDGNRVQVWACNGDAAQQWYGPSPQSGTLLYEVRASQASGYCLDNAGGSSTDGNPIQIWSCLGNPNQAWKYVPSVNGVTGDYQLENSNGLCLDDPGDSAVNGTRVQLWSCLGNPNQTWTQVTVGSYVEYVNANGLCLDNTGNSLTDGNRVQVWACLGDPAQQWYGPSPVSGT
jgi:YVTN family beta-propeller protein